MHDTWTPLSAGDRTLVLEFGQSIDREIVDQVVALDARIHAAMSGGKLHGIVETIPTFRSLALVFDPLRVLPDELIEELRALDTAAVDTSGGEHSHWQIPVHYGGQSGPDLESVAELTGLSAERVIELHQSTRFKVYMLGFLPGFAFLGDTPEELHLPRRSEPRVRVPAGSVAIANQLTGVYPWDSPGGWHILGHCPIPLFDGKQDPPALFKTGDIVSFQAIDLDEMQALKNDMDKQQFQRSSLRQSTS
ncbi:5-oxoprolinase subunit PxpB [Granulosicoccus sp. 3-233]|uniref:5-oxoprolinase subunit PxpB n=1 Tax=Granulosicoccus sp. 3-233 TaxID=3417969 RepID=UPI003D34CE0E